MKERIEIRGARPEENADITRIYLNAFKGLEGEELENAIDQDAALPTPEEAERDRILIADGKIVSRVRVVPKRIKYGAAWLEIGGIGGVGTLREMQGRGYNSRLMQATVDYMTEQGYPWTALAGIHNYYGRFGYITLWPQHALVFDTEDFSKDDLYAVLHTFEGEITVRTIDEKRDLPAIRKIYAESWRDHDGYEERAADWRAADWQPPEGYSRAIITGRGKIVGYALKNWAVHVSTGIAESVVTSPLAMGMLLLDLYMQAKENGGGKFQWITRPDRPEIAFLRTIMPYRLVERAHPCGGWAGRILNLEAAFENILPELNAQWRKHRALSGGSVDEGALRIETDSLGAITLELGERVTLSAAPGDVTVEVGHRPLAQVVFRFIRPEDITGDARAIPWLRALFPPRIMDLPAMSWF
jgi:predicted N-acetyltransferase YhbS